MQAAVVIGIMACQISCAISSKPRDCVAVTEACIAETDGCRTGWTLLKNVCDLKGGSCRIKGSMVCNTTIEYMVDHYPALRGCLCTNDGYCSMLQLLNPQCLTESGDKTSSHPSKPSWTEKEMDAKAERATPQNCLSAQQSCQQSHLCRSIYEGLKNSCGAGGAGGARCDSQGSGDACLSAWRHLRSTPLANCTCPSGRRKCLRAWNLVNRNPCIQYAEEALGLPDSRDQDNLHNGYTDMSQSERVSNMEWQTSGLLDYVHETRSSCLSEIFVCIHDKVCNRHLVPLVRACSENPCNISHCWQAMRQFYRGLPLNVAEMLALCQCDRGDQDCLRVKAHLQVGACGGPPDTPSSCLGVFDSCMEEKLCRQRYEIFQSKCLGTELTLCHPANDCLTTMDSDLILGGDVECRSAFIGTMGTVLQNPCTCDGLANVDQYKCNKLSEVFHNRSCFMRHLDKAGESHRTSKELKVGFQWFSYELFFVSICTLVIVTALMGVIWVLHKKGMFRASEKSRFLPALARHDFPVIY